MLGPQVGGDDERDIAKIPVLGLGKHRGRGKQVVDLVGVQAVRERRARAPSVPGPHACVRRTLAPVDRPRSAGCIEAVHDRGNPRNRAGAVRTEPVLVGDAGRDEREGPATPRPPCSVHVAVASPTRSLCVVLGDLRDVPLVPVRGRGDDDLALLLRALDDLGVIGGIALRRLRLRLRRRRQRERGDRRGGGENPCAHHVLPGGMPAGRPSPSAATISRAPNRA